MSAIEELRRNRNMPFLKRGLRFDMDGKIGHITGVNGSGHLTARYDGQEKRVIYLHPKWQMTYYDKDGNVIVDYRNRP